MENLQLNQLVVGRHVSFLHQEINNSREQIAAAVAPSRILVIGAAGSIGAAFTRELVKFSIQQLHLVDISENNLVELIRGFRSGGTALPDDFQSFAIDFTGPEMAALLSQHTYDYVLNFAALKHVRSERDQFTMMRMLEVNVLGNQRLLQQLCTATKTKKVFCVSSDKAVHPGNIMGASKAFMERVFLNMADKISFGSARFANVAFSDGSLLHSFKRRLELRQPLSAPTDVQRYFITHEEAGHLCLLGAFTGDNREIVFPKFQPERDMMTFADIARTVLANAGFDADECESEDEARRKASELSNGSRKWPCYFTTSDTGGEKPFEEFHDDAEQVDLDRYPAVGVVTQPLTTDSAVLGKAVGKLIELQSDGKWTIDCLKSAVSQAVPQLEHIQAGKNLDQKM